mmetsp:Transcript_1310/g.1678  ORF Transcript_1310/g.1678 Transcript_1310/m.1678 type:complete len:108 (+) Transcript_1310:325-648(+)
MAQSGDEYKELGCVKWSPLLALVPCFLPCFSNYQVEISGGKLTFGYGPLHCGTTVTVDLEDVEPDSVTEGIATCSDNLFFLWRLGDSLWICTYRWIELGYENGHLQL